VNLEKEEKAKAKEKTKEKGEDEEEEKEKEPLWWSKRKTPSSLTTPNKEAPLC
jgi:hypothetical protein